MYSCHCSFRNSAISIRTGGTLPVNACRLAKSPKNDIHQWKELNIEGNAYETTYCCVYFMQIYILNKFYFTEPFDLSNTARSVYDYATFERVKAIFVNSARRLEHTLELASIFTPIQHTQQVPMHQPSFYMPSNPHPHSHPHAHQAQLQTQQPPPSAESQSQTYPQLMHARNNLPTSASKLVNSGNFAPAATHVETGR